MMMAFTWGSRKDSENIWANYEIIFHALPVRKSSPMEKGESPEIDQSEELGADGVLLYQSLIGLLQWAVTLGRFDILVAVMSMSHFSFNPRVGHLERPKRIFGYLRKQHDARIYFTTYIPKNEDLFEVPEHDWMYSVFDSAEEIHDKLPVPQGKVVQLTTTKDANMLHYKVTGKSCTGILHKLNQMLIEWSSKRQNTVETATYGSELCGARQATE
jgi:hypothetical protein